MNFYFKVEIILKNSGKIESIFVEAVVTSNSIDEKRGKIARD